MLIYFSWTHIVFGLLGLALMLVILWKRKKSRSYLLMFSIFWIYMMGVVSVVAFPFPVGVANPGFKPSINLIPFNFGHCALATLCIQNIYRNILLTIPFGFGISFIFRVKPGNIFWWAVAVGSTFEFVQLIISFVIQSSFRVIDINDVILNAIGVLLGYGTFRIFGMAYSFITQQFGIQYRSIFAYMYEVFSSMSGDGFHLFL